MKIERKEFIEYVGVLALVLSLVFVGFEIRQNTNVARSNAYQLFNLEAANHQLGVAMDSRLNTIMEKMNDGTRYENLPFNEQYALTQYYNSVVRIWAGIYHPTQEGVIPTEAIEGAGMGGVFGHRAFQLLWPQLSPQYDKGFVNFVDSQIAKIEARKSD